MGYPPDVPFHLPMTIFVLERVFFLNPLQSPVRQVLVSGGENLPASFSSDPGRFFSSLSRRGCLGHERAAFFFNFLFLLFRPQQATTPPLSFHKLIPLHIW